MLMAVSTAPTPPRPPREEVVVVGEEVAGDDVTIPGRSSCPGDKKGSGAAGGGSSSTDALANAADRSNAGEGFAGKGRKGGVDGTGAAAVQSIASLFPIPSVAAAAAAAGPPSSNGDVTAGSPKYPALPLPAAGAVPPVPPSPVMAGCRFNLNPPRADRSCGGVATRAPRSVEDPLPPIPAHVAVAPVAEAARSPLAPFPLPLLTLPLVLLWSSVKMNSWHERATEELSTEEGPTPTTPLPAMGYVTAGKQRRSTMLLRVCCTTPKRRELIRCYAAVLCNNVADVGESLTATDSLKWPLQRPQEATTSSARKRGT